MATAENLDELRERVLRGAPAPEWRTADDNPHPTPLNQENCLHPMTPPGTEVEHPGCISARLDSRMRGGRWQCPRG